jgi:hypothetical protein
MPTNSKIKDVSDVTEPAAGFQLPKVEVTISPPRGARPAPEAANWFQLSSLGADIQLLVGYVDVQKLALSVQLEKDKSTGGEIRVRVEAELLHRLSLTPQGLVTLQKSIEQVAQRSRRSSSE